MKRSKIKKIIIVVLVAAIINTLAPISAYAQWNQNSKGNWNYIENNTKTTDWKLIDGKWYYFNKNGSMVTGWIQIKDKWYYLKESGEMNIGWMKDNDKWYYTNQSGEMETGEVLIDNKKYNFNSTGEAVGEETSPVEKIFAQNEQQMINNYNTSSDKVVPTLPQEKNIALYINGHSITVRWDKATDNKTPQDKLKYYLYQSQNKMYTTLSQWESKGVLLNEDNLYIDSFELDELEENNDYYFQLIVEDENGNKSLYNLEYHPSFF